MKNFTAAIVMFCASAIAFGQSTVTGVILPFANGRVTATVGSVTNNATIDNQGNFSIPVQSNSNPLMAFTPPSGSPYAPFSLTIYAGPGVTNITGQIAPYVQPIQGINLGIPNAAAIATNAQGFATVGTGGGGGSSVCPLQNATNICITQPPYSADPTGVTDASSAFIAAVTALKTAGGGTIWNPPGTYKLDGPCQDPGGANAIIPMPKIANYTGNPLLIDFEGFTTPVLTATPTSGAIFKTMATTCNLFGGFDSDAGGGFPNFTNVWLKMRNLTILAPNNPGIVAINAKWILAFIGDHLSIQTPGTLPSNAAGAGIILPTQSNNLNISLDQVGVSGFYTGIDFAEHSQSGAVYVANGVNDFVFEGGSLSNTISIDYLWCGISTNCIVAGAANSTVNIQVADMETLTGNGILDASNRLHGLVNFTVPFTFGATTSCNANVSGAANLQINPLQCSGTTSPYFAHSDATAAGGETLVGLGSLPITNSLSLYIGGTLQPLSAYSLSNTTATLGTPLSASNVVSATWATLNRAPGTISLSAAVGTPTSGWPMNDGSGLTLADTTGNSNPATINTGATVTWQSNSGLPGTTTYWNGSGYALATSTTKTNYDGTAPFTVGAWEAAGVSAGTLVGTLDAIGGTYKGWELRIASGNLTPEFFLIGTYPTSAIDVHGSTVANGTLHCVVATYDGSRTAAGVKIYVDSVLETPTVLIDNLSTSTANSLPARFASRTDGTNPMTGPMAFVEVFDGAFTGPQVTNFCSSPRII